MKTKKIAIYGLLIALAFIFSYIDHLIPIPFAVPGMKLGLANLVVLATLYCLGEKESFILSMLRILLTGFAFKSVATLAFSFAGGLLAWIVMVIFKRLKLFGMVGVSILGGISHNIGQIIVAIFYVSNVMLVFYLPILLISGIASGVLIGILGGMVVKRLSRALYE